MTDVQLFRDVSHRDYDRGQLDVAAYPMIVAKGTQGRSYVDPRFAYWATQHPHVAAYHWVDTSPIAAQVDNLLRVVGSRHPVMWDAEASGATVARLVGLTTETRARGGVVKAAYLPHSWWVKLGRPSLEPLADLGLFVINAWYDRGYGPGAPGWAGYGGMKPDILQYASAPFDLNAFYGTESQLLELWGFKGEDMLSGDDIKRISALIDDRLDHARDAYAHSVWHNDVIAGADGTPDASSAAGALEAIRNTVVKATT